MYRAVEAGDLDPVRSPDGNEDRMFQLLESVERNLKDLVQGLGLRGVRRCSHCKRFFRATSPGTLFGAGTELICLECIPAWWPAHRDQLDSVQRQQTEGDLVFWLRGFHSARSCTRLSEPAKDQTARFELVADCLECRGTGKYLGEKRCRYCGGPGKVRIVVPKESR